jgi:hypothetical protein
MSSFPRKTAPVLPAVFLIDPDGTLVTARYGGRAAEDRPPARD